MQSLLSQPEPNDPQDAVVAKQFISNKLMYQVNDPLYYLYSFSLLFMNNFLNQHFNYFFQYRNLNNSEDREVLVPTVCACFWSKRFRNGEKNIKIEGYGSIRGLILYRFFIFPFLFEGT